MQKQYWWDAYTGTTHQQLYLLVTVIQRCISAKHVRHEKQAYSPIQSIFPPNNFPTRKKMRNSPCTVRRYMPHLVRYLVPSWCGVSRTIEDCWKPWGISNPHRAAAPVNLLRDKAGMKTNERMNNETNLVTLSRGKTGMKMNEINIQTKRRRWAVSGHYAEVRSHEMLRPQVANPDVCCDHF